MHAMNAKQGTIFLAAQLFGLLRQFDKTDYSRPLPLFNGSTIGQHFRHILECYLCLFEGLPNSRVDYGKRHRNPALSDCPQAARAVLDYIAQTVKGLDKYQWVQVESEFYENPAYAGERLAYMSSVGRELQYAFDHAVHHMAMIRMGVELYFPQLRLDPEVGVAPSTLKHRKTTGTPDVKVPGREPVYV